MSTDTKISRYVKGFFLLILVGGALYMIAQPFPCVAAESLAQIASNCVVVNEKFYANLPQAVAVPVRITSNEHA